jgi:hypothetical protein
VILFPDPDLQWPSGSPYHWLETRLKEIGKPVIGPSSSVREINDALFDLMAGGPPVREDREAWDRLRRVDLRLALDFCMYQLRVPDDQLTDPALWDLVLPVKLPDFLRLANGLPDFGCNPSLPEPPDPGPPPQPVKIDVQTLQTGAVDIGPLYFDEETLWGGENA